MASQTGASCRWYTYVPLVSKGLTKKIELQLMHCAYAVSSCSKSHLKDILLYDYLPLKNFDVNIKVHLH